MLTIDTIPLCQFWILDLGFSIARETLFFNPKSKIPNPKSQFICFLYAAGACGSDGRTC
jgi:hypothetical protein